jgi:hypothetical protein
MSWQYYRTEVSEGEKTEALAVKEVIYFIKGLEANSEVYRIAVQVAKAAG